jgi:tetratricopeptide (TPR) repeat protein
MMSLKAVPLDKALRILFLVLVAAFSITKIQDPDVWGHMSMGRAIFEVRGLPETEPYLYSTGDKPFYFPSQLFALLTYGAYQAAGFPGIIVFNTVIITLTFWLMLGNSSIPVKNTAVSLAMIGFAFLLARSRFVGRPEVLLYLMTAAYSYILNRHWHRDTRLLYLLPILTVIWNNAHASIILMPIPFLAYLSGAALQKHLHRKGLADLEAPSRGNIRKVALTFLASAACLILTPRPWMQFTWAIHVLSQKLIKKSLLGLQYAREPGIVFVVCAVLVMALAFYLVRRRINWFNLLYVLPFLVFPLIAIRLKGLLAIAVIPVLAQNIAIFVGGQMEKGRISGRLVAAAAAVFFCLCATMAAFQAPPLRGVDQKYGLGLDDFRVPSGAVAYMKENGIEGRIFNAFEWGHYIAWEMHPEVSTFIDGRGQLPDRLYELFSLLRDKEHKAFVTLQDQFGFESALLRYPMQGLSTGSYDYGQPSRGWALVYWDDISMLYLKEGGMFDETIRRDAYSYVWPSNLITSDPRLGDIAIRRNIKRELERNIREVGSSRAHAFVGVIHNMEGRHNEAIAVLSNVRPSLVNMQPLAWAELGIAYASLGQYEMAERCMKKALRYNPEVRTFYNLAKVYELQGQAKKAIKTLKKAIATDRLFLPSYESIVRLYRSSGNEQEARKYILKMKDAETDLRNIERQAGNN